MNPRGGNQPNLDAGLRPVCSPLDSLAESLADVVDDANQLVVDLGLRPYRVFAVTYRWSGGAVGLGTASVFSEVEFLPTPLVGSLNSVTEEHKEAGLVERGTVTISGISLRYTEDQLNDMCRGGALCTGAEYETFIEVTSDRDGSADRRRFTLDGVPYRDMEAMAWRVTVMRQDGGRNRDGSVSNIGMRDPFARRR